MFGWCFHFSSKLAKTSVALSLIAALAPPTCAQESLLWISPGHDGVKKVVAASSNTRLVSLDASRSNFKRWNYATGEFLGTSFIPHYYLGDATDIAVSPQGDLIAVIEGGQELLYYSMATGDLLADFDSPNDLRYRSVRFSHDGSFVLIGATPSSYPNSRQTVIRKPTLSDSVDRTYALPASVGSDWLEIAPDDSVFVAGGPYYFALWRLRDKAPYATAYDQAYCGALSPDGKFLAIGEPASNLIHIWDVRQGKPIAKIPTPGRQVTSVAFDPETGDLEAISLGSPCAVGRWRHGDWVPLSENRVKEYLTSIAPVSGGKFYVSGNSGVTRYDLAAGIPDQRVVRYGSVGDITFSADDSSVLSGGWDTRLFAASDGSERWAAHFDVMYGSKAISSPHGSLIAAVDTHEVRVLNATDRRLVRSFPYDTRVEGLAFSPNANWLAVGQASGSITVFDILSGQTVARITAAPSSNVVPRFTPDGRRLLVRVDNSLTSYDTTTWGAVAKTSASMYNNGGDLFFAISPDGKLVAATSNAYPDYSTKILRTDTLQIIATLPQRPAGLQFSPDSSTLWMNLYDHLAAYRISDGAQVFSTDHREINNLWSFDISKDYSRIAFIRMDGTIGAFANPLR